MSARGADSSLRGRVRLDGGASLFYEMPRMNALSRLVSELLAASGAATSDVEPFTPMENLWLIVKKPDNIPILMMIIGVAFFTYLALRDGLKHDRLIREG